MRAGSVGSVGAVCIAICVALAGCLLPESHTCGDLTCPNYTVCTSGRCVRPEQVTACQGLGDNAPCVLSDGAQAGCFDGVCTVTGCGNDFVEPGEACDDGNVASNDGCSADCKSTEVCGNGIRDTAEGCDCGDGAVPLPDGCNGANSNAPGASCRPNCQLPNCGDGSIEGPEECEGTTAGATTCQDLGFYAGTLGCTGCHYDTTACAGFCGDGVLNGAEECDDANTTSTFDDVFAGTCTDLGFYNPMTIKCDPRCSYDDSACTGRCGDRTVDATEGEPCDGKRFTGGCVSLGYESGALSCSAGCAPDQTACNARGWRTIASGLTGLVDLAGVWVFSPTDAIAVGYGGAIRRWNGTTWNAMTSPTTEALLSVWAASATDVFAVGGNGTILRFNGTSWSSMSSGTTSGLFSVWGSSASNVIAVGYGGVIVRFNGTSWSTMNSGTSQHLQAVWVASATDAFAVGDNSTIVRLVGGAWQPMSVDSGRYFLGVWGLSSNDVIAVGEFGIVRRWNGSTWQPVSVPTNRALYTVWGTGPNEIFVTGGYGIALRWNGSSWTDLTTATTASLIGLHGTSSANVMAVGPEPSASAVTAVQWRGTELLPMTAATSAYYFYDMAGTSASNVFAVQPVVPATVQHWDGASWVAQTLSGGALLSVAVASPAVAYAVGQSGMIYKYSNGTWSPMTSGTSTDLNAVWAATPTDVFAGGASGVMLRGNGSSWTTLTPFTSHSVASIWGSSSNDVFVLAATELWHWNGSSWSQQSYGPISNLFDVWGSGPNDVFLVGSSGDLFHYDGASWKKMASGTTNFLRAAFGTGPSDVYAVGGTGTVIHFDGISWSPMAIPTSMDQWAGFAAGEALFTASENGTLYRRSRPCSATEECGDGVDNDCDGFVDCSDSDCSADNACMMGGLCADYTAIACGGSSSSSTVGAPSRINSYACGDWLELGRERVYRVTRPTNGVITATLSNMSTDLDLVALRRNSAGACDPQLAGCIAASSTTGNETVSFTAAANVPYFIVVEGYGSNAGTFTVNVACP